MAPRPIEPFQSLERRIREGRFPVRYGAPHHTHAVVQEGERYAVRSLQLDPAKGQAFLKERGFFMPENAEDLSEPTGRVEFEAATLDEVVAWLRVKYPR